MKINTITSYLVRCITHDVTVNNSFDFSFFDIDFE